MEQSSEIRRARTAQTKGFRKQGGCYVYCIVPSTEQATLGAIGINGSAVHTVVYNDLCALVHSSPDQPYKSDDAQVAAQRVMAHHQVVEAAWKRWGTALPMAFNTIIVPERRNKGAEQELRDWLKKEQDVLQGKLNALRGKAEYGFQVLWDPALVAGKVAQETPELRRLEEEVRAKPRGIAYMYRQKLGHRLKREMESRASVRFQELYARLSLCAGMLQVEKVKEADRGRQMIANLSCLVAGERYPDLEALAEEVSKWEGCFVRLVGPLPPYSFC